MGRWLRSNRVLSTAGWQIMLVGFEDRKPTQIDAQSSVMGSCAERAYGWSEMRTPWSISMVDVDDRMIVDVDGRSVSGNDGCYPAN